MNFAKFNFNEIFIAKLTFKLFKQYKLPRMNLNTYPQNFDE